LRLGVKAALVDGLLVDGDVSIEDGAIAAVGVQPAGAEGIALPGFVDVHINGVAGVDFLTPRRPRLEIARDDVTGQVSLTMARSFSGAKRLPSGLEYHDEDPVTFSIVEGDPLSARVECRRHIVSRRADWETSLEVTAVMTADADSFHVASTLDAFEGGTRVHHAAHSKTIPRDHV